MSFSRYPLPIFNRFLQIFLSWVIPFAFVSFYPATHFFGPEKREALAYASPLVALASCGVAAFFWKNEKLLHGKEDKVYADSAYANAARKKQYEADGVKWRVSRKAKPGQPLSKRDKLWNRAQSRVRAFGEHPFHVLKVRREVRVSLKSKCCRINFGGAEVVFTAFETMDIEGSYRLQRR